MDNLTSDINRELQELKQRVQGPSRKVAEENLKAIVEAALKEAKVPDKDHAKIEKETDKFIKERLEALSNLKCTLADVRSG